MSSLVVATQVADDFHGIFVWVGGSIIAAAIVAFVVYMYRSTKVLKAVERFVLPHFEPPSEQEIREGAKDRTIPARLGRLEEYQVHREQQSTNGRQSVWTPRDGGTR